MYLEVMTSGHSKASAAEQARSQEAHCRHLTPHRLFWEKQVQGFFSYDSVFLCYGWPLLLTRKLAWSFLLAVEILFGFFS